MTTIRIGAPPRLAAVDRIDSMARRLLAAAARAVIAAAGFAVTFTAWVLALVWLADIAWWFAIGVCTVAALRRLRCGGR